MKKILPLLSLFALLLFCNCSDTPSTSNNAEAQKTAADEKIAVTLDSISNEIEKDKADIEESVLKLEEGLKAIEE